MRIYIHVLLVAFLFSLYSCGPKDPDCMNTQYETVNLTSGDEAKIPYTGYDTLHFLSKQGDTCILRGTGKQYFYEDVNETSIPVCPPTRTTHYQGFSINFIAIKGDLHFNIKVHSSVATLEVNTISNFDNNVLFAASYNQIGTVQTFLYHDSLEIAGTYYYKVFKMSSIIEGIPNAYDPSNIALINNQLGILYLANTTNSTEYSFIKP